MQDQQLDGPTEQSEQSEQSPIWVHDPRSIELRGQWPDAEVTSSIGDTAALIMREVEEMEHRYYARATTGRRAAGAHRGSGSG
jgi:hypothetical protein